MKFSDLIVYLESISLSNSRNFTSDQLSEIFKSVNLDEIQNLTYFLCGSFGPDYGSSTISIGTKQMVGIVRDYLGSEKFDLFSNTFAQCGDVAEAFEQVCSLDLLDQKVVFEDISLKEFFVFIENLKETTGQGSVQAKGELIINFLRPISPKAAKYTIKFVLGQLRLGFLQMTVIDGLVKAFISDQPIKLVRQSFDEAYNKCADLGLIARRVKEFGLDALQKIKIVVGIPVRPAAAEAMESFQDIVDKLGPSFVAQPKLDGLRLQVHFQNNNDCAKVSFFSRNLLNCSDMFPDLQQAFASSFSNTNVHIQNFIIEGEVICVDLESGKFLPFQETAKRKRKYNVDLFLDTHPVKFFAFDLLFCDNLDLIKQTHEYRREKLIQLFSGVSNKIIGVIQEQVFNGSVAALELEDYFNVQMDLGLEGIVAKRVDAPYKAGKRDFSWIKLKRVESGELYDSIDVVVLGYYRGLGRRASFGIGGVLVGIYISDKDKFQTIAKVGGGLSDELWLELKNQLDKLAVLSKPAFYDVSDELEPHVWVSPEVVLSVRADQVTRSKTHTACIDDLKFGLALRFPRIVSFRNDKSVVQTTPEKTIIDMFEKRTVRGSQ